MAILDANDDPDPTYNLRQLQRQLQSALAEIGGRLTGLKQQREDLDARIAADEAELAGLQNELQDVERQLREWDGS